MKILLSGRGKFVSIDDDVIGRDGENLQENIIFTFEDDVFIDGVGRLEYQIGDNKYYVLMNKDVANKNYNIPVKSIMTKKGTVELQLVINEAAIDEEIPIFKSQVVKVFCARSLNAEGEAPEEYPVWIDTANEKLAEVDNLDITATKVSDGVEISITDKKGIVHPIKVNDGEKGEQGEKGEPGQIKMIVVNELPQVGQDNTIYLVPIENPDIQGNNYAEYVYINNQWELLGKIGVQVDLSNFYTKQETNDLLNNKVGFNDYATASTGGVIRINSAYGFYLYNGQPYNNPLSYNSYLNAQDTAFIGKGTLENVITGKDLANKQYVEDYINSLNGNNISY